MWCIGQRVVQKELCPFAVPWAVRHLIAGGCPPPIRRLYTLEYTHTQTESRKKKDCATWSNASFQVFRLVGCWRRFADCLMMDFCLLLLLSFSLSLWRLVFSVWFSFAFSGGRAIHATFTKLPYCRPFVSRSIHYWNKIKLLNTQNKRP